MAITMRAIRLTFWAVLAAVAAVPAVAQTRGAPPPPAAAQPSAADQDYVNKVTIGDMFEIASSHVALSKSTESRVQAFARMMVDDHGKMSAQLKKVVGDARLSMQLPAELDAEHRKKLDQLQSADAAGFDALYLEMQMKAHQEALRLHSGYRDAGGQPRLKTVAMAAVPIVQGHLDRLRTLAAR